jgi:hypothetical protein
VQKSETQTSWTDSEFWQKLNGGLSAKFPDYPQFKNQKNTQKEQFISAPDEPRLADCPRIRHGLSVNRAERRK